MSNRLALRLLATSAEYAVTISLYDKSLFDLLRASYPCAVAGCGAGGNIFDPEDWCDVFATESVYLRSGCVAMALGA